MRVWTTGFGRLIRWLLFIPIGYLLACILQTLPPLAFALAWGWKLEFNFFVLIVAVIAVSFLTSICVFWCACVYLTPYLSCKIIAPDNKVGSVIFGTLFCLFQGIFLLKELLGHDPSWLSIIYQIVFAGIVIVGTVTAYKET